MPETSVRSLSSNHCGRWKLATIRLQVPVMRNQKHHSSSICVHSMRSTRQTLL